jgi:hypothetical protein
MNHQKKIEDALKNLDLIGEDFRHGETGIAFSVNRKRLHLTYTLLKLSRNIVSIERAIQFQLGEKVG